MNQLKIDMENELLVKRRNEIALEIAISMLNTQLSRPRINPIHRFIRYFGFKYGWKQRYEANYDSIAKECYVLADKIIEESFK